MATRKTTTRGKTKTPTRKTTKPATNAARTTRAARTTKVSTKVTALKGAASRAKQVKTSRTNWLTINRLLIGATVLYAALAAAAVFLMDKLAPPVTLTHLTDDPLLSQTSAVLTPASRELFNIDLRWLLVSLLVLSMVLLVLYLTKLKNFYADKIANRRVIPTRWLDLAISSVIMVEIIGLLVGITDLMMLKLMGGMMIATCALGWLAERQNEQARRPEWSAYAVSVFTGFMPWVVIGVTKAATLFYGGVRSPWYVYALCIAALLGFSGLALNQFYQHLRFKSWVDYAIVERNYLLLNTVTKVAFAVILIVGLSK